MAKKLFLAVGSSVLFAGMIAIQGCSDSSSGYGYGRGYYSSSGYGYGPGYYSSPGYYSGPAYYGERRYYAGNGYAGDYDQHRYWQDRDIHNDVRAIRRGQAKIRQDKQELREALENRDYRDAAHERREIQQRRANIRARKADLNADRSYRY
jgi:hypothetical protein